MKSRSLLTAVVAVVVVSLGIVALFTTWKQPGAGSVRSAGPEPGPQDQASTVSAVREGGRAPALEAESTTEPIQAVGDAPNPASAAATDGEAQSKKWLLACLADLETANSGNAEQRVERALVTSIAAQMDRAGTSVQRQPGVKLNLKELVPAGFQFFIQNNSYYRFRIGEYPDYDALLEFRARRGQWVDGQPRNSAGAAAEEDWRKSEPHFPMDLVQQAKDRAQETLALLH